MDGWMDGFIKEDFVFQGKECASLYSMKMYVEPNEIESALVRTHLNFSVLFDFFFQFSPQICAQAFVSLLQA